MELKWTHTHTETYKRYAIEYTTEIALTIPGVKHISDEVVYEGDLRFGHAAGVPVKHWHHHRQPLSLFLICLQGKHTDPKEVTMAKVNAHNENDHKK